MSMQKKIVCGLLGLCVSLPILANASALTIINNTSHDSTCILNHGPCSDFLGEAGITRHGATNIVPERILKQACKLNKNNCVADVYMTANCSGPAIATVTLNVNSGITSIVPSSNTQGYNVTANDGFTAVLSGGPAIINWFKKLLGM